LATAWSTEGPVRLFGPLRTKEPEGPQRGPHTSRGSRQPERPRTFREEGGGVQDQPERPQREQTLVPSHTARESCQ